MTAAPGRPYRRRGRPYPARARPPGGAPVRRRLRRRARAGAAHARSAPSGQPRSGASVAALLDDPARLQDLLDARDPAERDVLSRLAEGPPVGVVRDASCPPPGRGRRPHVHPRRAAFPDRPPNGRTPPPRSGWPCAAAPVRPRPAAAARHRPTDADLDRLGTTAVLDNRAPGSTRWRLWSGDAAGGAARGRARRARPAPHRPCARRRRGRRRAARRGVRPPPGWSPRRTASSRSSCDV